MDEPDRLVQVHDHGVCERDQTGNDDEPGFLDLELSRHGGSDIFDLGGQFRSDTAALSCKFRLEVLFDGLDFRVEVLFDAVNFGIGHVDSCPEVDDILARGDALAESSTEPNAHGVRLILRHTAILKGGHVLFCIKKNAHSMTHD